MAREFLKGIKSENRLSKIRLIKDTDRVIGGQPSDNAEEFTSNTPFLDLACSIQYAVTQAANANTAASNADKKAGTAQTTANQAKTAAATADGKAVAAQKTADEAKTAAATADGKAVAAQKTADEAKTAAATADSKAVAADKKAGTAQTTANQAKTAAATADGKAVAAQKTADEAKTAAATADSKAVAADKKAGTAQTTATGAKTAADNAQKKANQVPNPVLDQLPIGASGTAYKLITIDDLKTKLGVPAKTNVVQTTGTSTTDVISQKGFTDAINALNVDYALVDFGVITSATGIHKKPNPFGNTPVLTIAEIKLGDVWTQYNWFEGTTAGQTYGITSGFNGSDIVIRVGSRAIVPKVNSSSALTDAVNETHHEASAPARMHVWRLKK